MYGRILFGLSYLMVFLTASIRLSSTSLLKGIYASSINTFDLLLNIRHPLRDS